MYRFPPVTITVKFVFSGRMGSELNLLIKWSITIGTMINFDGDGDGHWYRNATCKAVFTLDVCVNVTVKFNIVSMETQTQTHRMGLNPFLTFSIDTMLNLTVTLTQTPSVNTA